VRGPVVIGEGTVIEDAFIGPYTSIGRGCTIKNAALEHSVILDNAKVIDIERLEDSVIGRNALISKCTRNGRALRLMVGDDAEVLL
jgi:glucose-1-phosphate thymidylyltransferase